MTVCPTEQQLVDHVDGRTGGELLGHLDECADCRLAVAELVAGDTRPARGARLGRFVVLHSLGAGGMGVVYAAYDPTLDRKVAIKLLRADARVEQRARITREAQAMARLSHPNVVQVYEVGTVGEQVFIAMELIEGGTLGEWLRSETRHPAEIMRHLEFAGRGLAAAHRVGLVHRDFKPENVLIARDGRVRVTDFGLATDARDPGTEHGGTPAYLAPEQLEQAAVDARADQFSFCVVLYEALFGVRPFDGKTLDARRAAVFVPLEVPRRRGVPMRVRGALARGLARDPVARWPSMQPLLRALYPTPAHSRVGLASAGIAVMTAAIVVAAWPRAPAEGGRAELAAVWDASRRSQLEAAFAAADPANASRSAAAAGRMLDQYAEAWIAAYHDAYAATHVRREQSADLLDRRMVCLQLRLEELRALVDLFVHADAEIVEDAPDAVSKLSDVRACSDTAALLAKVPLPHDDHTRAAATTLRAHLAQLKALLDAGRATKALPFALRYRDDAIALGYAPLVGEAWFLLGDAKFRTGAFDDARSADLESSISAQAGADDVLATRASLGIADALNRLGRYDEGLEYVRIADGSFTRSGRPTELEPMLHDLRGRLLRGKGKFEEARQEFTAALAIRERTLPPNDSWIGSSLKDLGGVALQEGRAGEARDLLSRALAIREPVLGPNHPSIATVLTDLGSAELAMGDVATARIHLERALAIRERRVGAQHPDVATTLLALAHLEERERHLDIMRHEIERAFSIRNAALGPAHPDTIAARSWLERLPPAEQK
jgi:serine/threonine protein kinase